MRKLGGGMVHRAITVVVMIVICVLLLAFALIGGLRSMGWGGLVPLLVLVGVSVVVGVLISWRRYFPGARRRPRQQP
ncbi:MAG: hypothetical protein ACREQM_00560 [Candidatus Dormibacteraceae bacterium]